MKNCGFYMAMVLVQFAYGGSNILIKIALERSFNQFVFVVYRHIIALLLLGPPAYVLERMEKVKIKSASGEAKAWKGKLDQRFCSYSYQLHCMKWMANSPGYRI
ncbi:hypothetical protein DITRI_Ditri04bG0151900 [Diplodiscus trichospermus]